MEVNLFRAVDQLMVDVNTLIQVSTMDMGVTGVMDFEAFEQVRLGIVLLERACCTLQNLSNHLRMLGCNNNIDEKVVALMQFKSEADKFLSAAEPYVYIDAAEALESIEYIDGTIELERMFNLTSEGGN